jgi:flagellar biosynthetic protein FliR
VTPFGPNIYQFPEGQIVAFVLVLLRISAFFVAWPVFGTILVPTPVKILLSICVALMMFPIIHFQNLTQLQVSEDLIVFAFREVALGLVMGFMMRMFFFAISIAGEITSTTIGLSSGHMFNPTLGSQSTTVEQFQLALATLFFLSLSGHHLFLSGLGQSFELLPVSTAGINYKGFVSLSVTVEKVFLLALKMCAPVLIAILLTNLSMGIVGRAVPQINVLVTSLPVTISVGLGVVFVSIPLVLAEMTGLLDVMATEFFRMMRVL